MLRTPLIASSVCLAALAIGGAAQAQVSAQALWDEWQAQSAASQQVVSAESESYANGTLTLQGFSAVSEVEGTNTVATLDQVVIAEQADGTAVITMSSPYAIRVEQASPFLPEGQTQTIEMDVSHQNLRVVASGMPGDRTFVYTADSIAVTDGEITDEFGDPVEVDIDFTIAGVEATYSVQGTAADENLVFQSESTAQRMTVVVTGVDGATNFNFNMALSDIAGASDGDLSALMQMGTSNVMPDGVNFTAEFTYGAAEIAFGFTEPTENLTARTTNQGGSIGVGIMDTVFAYAIRGTQPVINVQSNQLPFPVDISADSTEVDIAIPMRPGTGGQQQADILVSYLNMVVGDPVWSMFDPGQAIPRTPATMVVDLSAQLIVLQDLLNPEAVGFGPPFDPRSVTLDALQIAFGGAELTGSGAVQMPGGMANPQPQGIVNLQLTGGQALLAALSGAGLLPQEQAMMSQMMLGMIAVPGSAPDTLVSEIEFLPNGSITANGNPLPF